ncbi:hypothetical protein C804_04018 [Lachnospiraceae bacterium A4]|nr:hypothetical protein C804_04018 [Lachnospiraceae bacterium A4]
MDITFNLRHSPSQQIEKAYFISPVVDMERLIADMMIWANHGIIFAM